VNTTAAGVAGQARIIGPTRIGSAAAQTAPKTTAGSEDATATKTASAATTTADATMVARTIAPCDHSGDRSRADAGADKP
jgi:hypothetical protein